MRQPKSAHQNADSDSRQTNMQNELTLTHVESALLQIHMYEYKKTK